jgi:hypothetical protein
MAPAEEDKAKSSVPFPGIALHIVNEQRGPAVITPEGAFFRMRSASVRFSHAGTYTYAGKHLVGDDLAAVSDEEGSSQGWKLRETRENVVQTGWSKPFSIDSIGEDFKIQFYAKDIDLDNVPPRFLALSLDSPPHHAAFHELLLVCVHVSCVCVCVCAV